MIDKPGVYQIPAEQYHADRLCQEPTLSSSGARKIISTCPALFWWDRNHPEERTTALDIGSAAHAWLLEGDEWPGRHFVLPEDHNGRTNAGKERRAEAERAGLIVIKADHFAEIKAMHDALQAHPFAASAFRHGKAEQTLIWRDETSGVWCRARPDFLPTRGRIVADYKTTRSADPRELPKSIFDYGYHQQAAWYIDGIEALGLIEDPAFAFVFQEKTAPYLITVATLSPTALMWGREQNARARKIFAHCLRAGVWPGYADDVVELNLPGWADQRLEREAATGLHEPLEQAA